MKILAIDSSGLTASAAIVSEDSVIAEFNTDFKKTHSLTLLPMIESLFKMTGLDVEEIDAVAISKGPGSFTGLRIGSATAKGIAMSLDKKLIEISTLEAMAFQLYGCEEVIVPLMDARRQQVYAGIYEFKGERLSSVEADEAIAALDLIYKLNDIGRPVILLGDGVPVNIEILNDNLKVPFKTALPFQNRQRAAALGILAVQYAKDGKFTDPDDHAPVYLRMSQAERERLERAK